MSDQVTISKKEYLELRIRDLKLDMLEAGGVDNWDNYGDSLRPDGEENFREQSERIKKEIESL